MIRFCLGLLFLTGALCGDDKAQQKAAIERLFAEKKIMSPKIVVGAGVPIESIVIQTDAQGFPTLNAIKQLMEKDFFSAKKQGAVVVAQAARGSYSDAIYSIGLMKDGKSRTVFFLKISKSIRGRTADRLSQIQIGKIGRLGLEKHYNASNPLVRKYLPIIVWLEKIYKYKGANGSEYFMELSHAARGEQVSNIINAKSSEQISNCGYCVGRSLGLFQQVFIKYVDKKNPTTWLTVAHKDFHSGNIFFDEKTEKVYFIDNETMKENCSIFDDTIYLIEKLMNNLRFDDDAVRILNFIFSFLNGYLGVYPKSQRCEIALMLEKSLLTKEIVQNIEDFTVSKCVYDVERKDIDCYKYFMNQYVQFLKSNIMNLGACGASDINIAVYKDNYSYVQSVSTDVINSFDKFGMMPLFWALEKNDLKMLRLLNSVGVNILKESRLFPRGVLEYFVLQDDDKAVRNVIDTFGLSKNILEPLLVKAALYGSANTVKMLLNEKIDVNVQLNLHSGYNANDFVTPLFCAASLAHVSVVQELLQNKDVEINFLDRLGRNSLLRLAMNVGNFSVRKKIDANNVAKMLIEAGADVTLKNRSGKTAFDIMPSWVSYQKSNPGNASKSKSMPGDSQKLLIDALELSCMLKKK